MTDKKVVKRNQGESFKREIFFNGKIQLRKKCPQVTLNI